MAFFGVPGVIRDTTVFAQLARVVFHELADSRGKLHTAGGQRHCDGSFQFEPFRVSGDCPCVGQYLDALAEVCVFLERQEPAGIGNVYALARTHLRLRVIRDLNRRRRAERTQQRTDRLERSAIGQALRTPEQRALLRHIVDEAASDSPLDSDDQLFRRLAQRRADEFGGTPDDHLDGVRRDLPVVRQTTITHGRRQRDAAGVLVLWWERYVESGLGRREQRSTIPIITTAPEGDPAEAFTIDLPDPRADEPFEAVLRAHALTQATGLRVDPSEADPDLAVVRVLTTAVGSGTTPPQVRAAVRAALVTLGRAEVVPRDRLAMLLGDNTTLDEVVHATTELSQVAVSKFSA